MATTAVLLAVFVMMMGNATVLATVGLFGRAIGLGEIEVGAIIASSALFFFITSSWWGRLADRKGRRPVILSGLVGAALSLLLFAGLFTLERGEVDVFVAFAALLGSRILYGILCGGVQPAGFAYMADITAARDRSTGAAMVGAAVGLGSMAGPALVALLIGRGFAVPILAACVLTSLTILAVAAILRNRPHTPQATAVGTSTLGKVTPYLALAFVIHLAFAALQATNAFYIQDLLGLDTMAAVQRASLISMTFAASSFAVQAFAIRTFKGPPVTLLWIGLIVCLLASAACLMAPGFGWLLAAFGFLGAGFAWAQSGLMAGASLASRDDSQGQVAGHLQAAMAAAWIVGPLIGAAIYEVSIKGPLALAAGAMALAMLGLAVRRRT